MSTNELFYRDDKDKKRDAALHAPILNNPDAERDLAAVAIERAVANGTPRDLAQRLYGI